MNSATQIVLDGFNGSSNGRSTTIIKVQSNISEYIYMKYGPNRGSLELVIPMTIIYLLIFITGLFGNIATSIVILKNKYMQTATNFYLFNLALADFVVIVFGLPVDIYHLWSAYPDIFGEWFCICRAFIIESSTYSSILTITAFTAERYLAICHPICSRTVSTLSRVVKLILIIWLISCVFAVPISWQFGINYLEYENEKLLRTAVCNVIRPLKRIFEVSTFLFFFTPMTIIAALYALIGWTIRKSTLDRQHSDNNSSTNNNTSEFRNQQQSRARRAVLKMLVAVVVAFFVCWAPFHTQRLLTTYTTPEAKKKNPLKSTLEILYNVSGIFYYISSVINPILYNIMSIKFRQAFINTLFNPCKRRRKIKLTKTAYQFANRPLLGQTKSTHMNCHGGKGGGGGGGAGCTGGLKGRRMLANYNLNLRHFQNTRPSSSTAINEFEMMPIRREKRDEILTDFKSVPCPSTVAVSWHRDYHSYT